MFSFRVLFRFVPSTLKHCGKQRSHLRSFVSTVNGLEPQIVYPNGDQKFGKYLDRLSEKSNEAHSKEIRWKYGMRKSLVEQLLELETEMKNENDAEILNMAMEERQVSGTEFHHDRYLLFFALPFEDVRRTDETNR